MRLLSRYKLPTENACCTIAILGAVSPVRDNNSEEECPKGCQLQPGMSLEGGANQQPVQPWPCTGNWLALLLSRACLH